MSERDEELERFQRELQSDIARGERRGDPYVHTPDTMNVKDGMSCWLDEGRICNATCMAYNTAEVDDEGVEVQGADKCLVLSLMKQQSSGAVAAAAASTKVSHRRLAQLEDSQRPGANVPPPDPFGRKNT